MRMSPAEACAPVVLSPAIISVVRNGNAKMHEQVSGLGAPLEPGSHFDLPDLEFALRFTVIPLWNAPAIIAISPPNDDH